MDACVLCIVGAVWLAKNLGGIRPEGVLEVAQRLGTQLVSIADEKGVGVLTPIRDTFEEVYRNERFTSARGERKEGSLGFGSGFTLCRRLLRA